MRRRLASSFLLLILVVLAALEIPLGVVMTRHDRSILASQVLREATGLSVLVGEAAEQTVPGQVQYLTDQYRARTGGEVIVVGPDGKVLASSEKDKDNDAREQRPLVLAALAGHATSSFTVDEGTTVAVGAAPVFVGGALERPGRVIRAAVLLDVPAMSVVSRARATWLALGAFGAGVLVLAALAAVYMARSIARPLAELEEAVARFAGGDLAARAAPAGGPPEVRSLAGEFNDMASRLSDLLEAQNRFVADASHQLRSPLTALRLRLENLEADVHGHASQGLAAAGRELQRLSRLVDGLLALTRAGVEKPRRERVELGRVIAERCEAWAALAEERGVALVNEGPPPSAGLAARLVPGDLDQILDNLLANAVDACPEGARISVGLIGDGLAPAEIHVTDSGPGLSAEDRERAFERFWQGTGKVSAGPAASAGAAGGLGLAIVRELAGRNGAAVELREAPGGGLDAVLRLPLLPGTPPAGRNPGQMP